MRRTLHAVAVMTFFAVGNWIPAFATQSSAQNLAGEIHLAATERAVTLRFANAEVKDILTFIAESAHVVVKYDQQMPQLANKYSVELKDVAAEDAFKQVLSANGLAFKVLSPTAIFVFVDSPENQKRYSQFIQNFYIRNADPQRIFQLIMETIAQDPTGIRPILQVNQNARTIDVRATPDKMALIAKIIVDNDKRQ